MNVPPETCPTCGAEVPRRSLACPECGADEKTGWSEAARAQQLGLPDEEFDHDEFVREEFGQGSRVRPRGVKRLWWWVALLLLLAFAVAFLSRFT